MVNSGFTAKMEMPVEIELLFQEEATFTHALSNKNKDNTGK